MAMTEHEVKELVGLTVEEALKRINEKGSYGTVASEDGQGFPVLTMYDINRVCFHVEKGKVTGATIG
jgi:hypothetical protein